ncbi:hypothetical protein PIB30_041128 [Stylosanthes scabra]|uniref:Leucine-rich repeat-containing N-terminal plant-type domain-containing protein n=1 Tax=Stylosanthes scabra TaxID=79078 RepID=A0ABU6RF30_9FABA|nr:hypothetical protein [Stylosanthes scabra]
MADSREPNNRGMAKLAESHALLHFKTQLIKNITFCEYYYDYAELCPHIYANIRTWKHGTDCCSWMGVTCDYVSGHVIGLDLSCSGLVGNIHPNSTLFHLTHLHTLNLAYNYFYGSELPSQFGGFVNLTHLNLSGCDFKGDIPSQISHLSELQSLDLNSNNGLKWKDTTLKSLLQNATALREIVLDDTDMSSIGPALSPLSLISNMSSSLITTLSLSFTEITGQLTSHILCLPNLHDLDLSENENIQIHVPNLNCSTSLLRVLDLSGCQFPGSQIPSSFSNLTHLTLLELFSSELNGSIPSFLSNLQHLTNLDLSDNNLSGQFPNVLGQLTKLQKLNLRGNRLGGKLLLSSLANLTQISSLDCSYNKFEGSLPDKIAGFTSLTELVLNDNLLNETIPSWYFSLPFLTTIDLSNNQFTGYLSAMASNSLQVLRLCGNKLQGDIPESMFNLVNLTELCLSSGNWSGSLHFPENLEASNVSYRFTKLLSLQLLQIDLTKFSKISWKFPKLIELELSENKLEGEVPQWIRDIDSLRQLKLRYNQLSSIGQFPWHQLKDLDLSFNSLSEDNISFICNATSLEIVNLSHNKFRGTIPHCLADLSKLIVLDLQMNKLHGTLPSIFPNSIGTLNLNGNQLEGHLPKSLSNCPSLEDLNLGDNEIEDTFPHWLQSLQYLEILVLGSNKLYGPIVSLKSKDMFPKLIIFDISSNNFSGQLPIAYIKSFQAMKIAVGGEGQSGFYYISHSGEYVAPNIWLEYDDSVTETMKGIRSNFEKIPNILVSIDLSNNRFEGEVPDDIGELRALENLNFSHNKLVGHIPRSLGNLTNLESLDLSSNMLTGEIPTELTNLNFLEVLNLSRNQLVGSIPNGKQFDTFSNDSYLGNMGLCGRPLSLECNNNVTKQQYPSSDAEDKFGFGWKPVAIGYACGTMLGIGLGFCVFWIGKPEWLVIIFGGTTTRIKRRSRGNRGARTT